MESSEPGSQVAPPLGSERKVLFVATIGIGLATLAAVTGAVLPDDVKSGSWVPPFRAIFSLLGMLIAGAAVTLRPKWFGSWLLASAAALAAGCGIPVSWYTISFAAFVFSVVAALGAVLAALPWSWRIAVVGALPVIHFTGILSAVLSPPPSPQMVNQTWTVVFRPYLQFVYLNNAYQFYSPDPGPASEVWFCIEYETRVDDKVQLEALQYNERGEPIKNPRGELVYTPMVDENDEPRGAQVYDSLGNFIFVPEEDRFGNDSTRAMFDEDLQPRYLKTYKWLKLPRRPRDRKDPLFQTYYRRLSLSENVSQTTPFSALPLNVQLDLRQRRLTQTPEANLAPRDKQIPLNENEWTIDVQYRLPNDQIQDIYLPSYVRHVARSYQEPERKIAAIKVYRVLHMIVRIDLFVGLEVGGKRRPWSAFDPATYLPYFVGEFDANGKLLNPSDPLLYWLIPISRRTDLSAKEYTTSLKKMRDYKRLYIDYVSAHAGSNHMVGELEK